MTPAARLRALQARPGLVRAIVPHDAFTARVAEQAGAEMRFLGGFGVAASAHGLPDLVGVGEVLGWGAAEPWLAPPMVAHAACSSGRPPPSSGARRSRPDRGSRW